MSTKPVFFKNLREGRKALTEIGLDPGSMSLREMGVSYNEQLKRNAKAVKTAAVGAKLIAPKAVAPTIADIKAALKGAKTADERLDALRSLRTTLEKSLKDFGPGMGKASAADMLKQSEIIRELNRVQKAEAYEALALRTEDPKAARARRLREHAERE